MFGKTGIIHGVLEGRGEFEDEPEKLHSVNFTNLSGSLV